MQIFVTIVFVGGATAFCVWSVLNLVGAIKDRKEKKRKQAENGGVSIDERKEDTDE